MDLIAREQAAANQLSGLGVGQYAANVKRPETALEATVSRMSAILSRVHGSAQRAENAANSILGYEGEKSAGGAPASVPTSVHDYLGEIESALSRLEYGLGRLT